MPESGRSPESLSDRDTRGLTASERFLRESPLGERAASGTAEAAADRAAAMVDGAALSWDQMRAALGEAAGREVLDEIALEAGLAGRFRDAGLTLDATMIDRERTLFEASAGAGGLVGSEARVLLERVRRERGLGPARFAALLRRNAMLRTLVQGQVVVNESAVRQAYELTHGPRLRARVIVVPTAREAGDATQRVRAGEDFSKVAAEMSTDASASRGGIIEPLSAADPSYPSALRDTLAGLSPGEIGGPVVLGDSFAVVRLDKRLGSAAAPRLDECRAEMETVARRRQERLLMEQLAREVRASTRVRALDGSLRWAIEER
ncbi:MAG: peptidylprolyl isomerase [Phycisphaerales bacterium]